MIQASYSKLSVRLAAALMFVASIGVDVEAAESATVFKEQGGLIAIEAEHFCEQTANETRAFYLMTADETPSVSPDGDPSHVGGASNGAYLEILPDTRRTHADKLIRGTNFSPEPGKMAIVSYKVKFSTPGRYYVWVRAYSTGSEDNGLHVGLNGEWPASGQRLQWCQGKKSWYWNSAQRTEANHCGEAGKIFLDIPEAGVHTISFSMREDGFEFDKWLMTTDAGFVRPADAGPATSAIASGPAPKMRAYADATESRSAAESFPDQSKRRVTMPAKAFADAKLTGYYLDRGKWLAVNPERHKTGSAARTFPYPTGTYHVILRMVGENDGASTYTVQVDDELIGKCACPLAAETYEEGLKYHKRFENVSITEGAIIGVSSTIASADGQEYSRARWSSVAFEAADAKTAAAVEQVVRRALAASRNQSGRDRTTSPTKNVSDKPLIEPRQADGDGSLTITGELKAWHKITLDLAGPFAHEQDNAPNPFTDYALNVTFRSVDGREYVVPGYFAADGNAGNNSADSGTTWRTHFAPDAAGVWSYEVSFRKGKHAALEADASSEAVAPFDGKRGSIVVNATNKAGRDLRAHGRLQYVGKHYLQFAGSKDYFLKAGADAPETLLAFTDFDDTIAGKPGKAPLKAWEPHVQDWQDGDPTWAGGKGKGLIGAINYLSGKGCNAFSFLTYNAGGDGDNVWPFIQREDKLHYDCSKLDQWGVVFDHGTRKGMYLHFKMQETEMDDHNRGGHGGGGKPGYVPECLDGGNLGPQRKLYCRELIARFGHNLALNWNLGEENTQSNEQHQAMINYIKAVDPYGHNIVIHTFPNQQDKIYTALLGDRSNLTGASLQNSSIKKTHSDTVRWVEASAAAGKPWVVAFDESGTASYAQVPDLGYKGFDGKDNGKFVHTQHEVRKYTLWGTLMGGGAGNEYYFGYKFVENDIVCEDWRSRDRSWDYCRIALDFFRDNAIPFWEMSNADTLIGNDKHDDSKYCFAKADEIYLVYLPDGGSSNLDLSDANGEFTVEWFNPRTGGELEYGTRESIVAGGELTIGSPPSSESGDDWLAIIRKR